MRKPKHWHDVRGWRIDCPRYTKCPLCYGCRAYDPSDIKCAKCRDESVKNVCDTSKHRADLLAKLIPREKIIVRK